MPSPKFSKEQEIMTTQAISVASLICLGRSSRARLIRAVSPKAIAGHASEFHQGMHAANAGALEQALAKDQMLVLDNRRLTLECLEGQLWLTRDGDAEDYILGPGQNFEVLPDDQAVIQAQRPSRIRLLPA